MRLTVTMNGPAPINLAPGSLMEEVLQNINMILSTVKNTVPQDRNFGLSARFIDKPTPVAESLIIGEIYDAIEQYEPRASIVNIAFERDEGIGKIIPRLEVEIDGGQ